MSKSYKKTPWCGENKGKTKKRNANHQVKNWFKRNPDDNFNSIIEFVETYIDKNSESKENEDLAISMVEEEIDKWNN